ncbi:NADase-type glycan-binding domain-containing protein [Leptospira santarosai]|uniref:NADase-type glycan-binding domain-containing protein n=1 Tax=Leptospira santarosai TaxID=28183 RepID=UPI000A620AB4
MKNPKRILVILILGVTFMLQAEGEKVRKDLIPIFKKCYRTDEDLFLVASSVLTEKGKPKNYYGPNNIDDQYIDTAWGVSKNQGVGEWIYTYNGVKWSKNRYDEYLAGKSQKNYFSFLNGLAKDATSFEENGRIKKVRIDVYEAEGDESMANLKDPLLIYSGPIENDSFELELKDTREEQTFEREILSKIKPVKGAWRKLLFKLTILETYPGTKSKNVFLTEFQAYSEDVKKEGFKITRERK